MRVIVSVLLLRSGSRLMAPERRNPPSPCDAVPYMDPINEVHVKERGPVVIDVAAADDATASAFQAALAEQWAAAPASRTTQDAGRPDDAL
ncbi:DUF6207 family protein [Streptomyces sp. NPDC056178]|uniref:DUF6207 family protein n=1 Tax=unclassified Streptomyces TaxID=2593676 RepID=UPI0035E36576